MNDQITAPFTPEQVENLNLYQRSGVMHPFTCGAENCRADLIATEAGGGCPTEGCEYTQKWAHAFMSDKIREVIATRPDLYCRNCKGTGIDPKTHYRYTSGGHDDRSCPECNGDGIRGE